MTTYEHLMNVNIGGTGMRPIVTVWCMDCLTTVEDFDQQVPYAVMEAAITEHRLRPSKREEYRRQREQEGES